MGKTIIEYKDNIGYAYCAIHYKNHIFEGEAFCAPEDEDFKSEKTGCFIAEVRARLQKLYFLRKELTTALSVLKNFENSLRSCKDFNEKSFEARRLRKEIYEKSNQLQEINNTIKDEKDYLKQYIDNKDKFYKRQRDKRGQNT